jgi:hypothetical protein
VLIGLNGRKQAGKDTVFERASHIMRDVLDVERVSFADKLYESAAAAIGVSVDYLREHKSDPRRTVAALAPNRRPVVELTLREYLQRYGTEAHRDTFWDSFWVDAVDLSHEGRIVMVTDVRFPNEAEAVLRAGGAVVEVIGPEGRVTADAHASEAPLPEELIDATIANTVRDDGFRALDKAVDALLRLHMGGAA